MIMMSTYIGDIVEQGTTPGIFMSAYEVKLRSHVAWKGDKNGVESLCGFFLPQVTKPPWFYPVGWKVERTSNFKGKTDEFSPER